MRKINCNCHCHTHDNSEKEGRNSQAVWLMLLSHHAACDMDRTWVFFGVNICTRCLCILLGLICTGMVYWYSDAAKDWGSTFLCILTMIPAGIDFTLGELLKSYPRTNIFRAGTGFLFGCGLGFCMSQVVFQGYWIPIVVFCLCAVLMQVAISFIFYASGHLEDYLKKYEDAVK